MAYHLAKKSVINAITADDDDMLVVDIWTKKDIRSLLALAGHGGATDEQIDKVMQHVTEHYHSATGLCNAVFVNAYLNIVLNDIQDTEAQ